MAILWAADGALTPGEVLESLGRELAYTTVMTTLVRLHSKGMATRSKIGRAYAYRPALAEEEQAAQLMAEVLAQGKDPAAVLTHFVAQLGPAQERLLRELLEVGSAGAGAGASRQDAGAALG